MKTRIHSAEPFAVPPTYSEDDRMIENLIFLVEWDILELGQGDWTQKKCKPVKINSQ